MADSDVAHLDLVTLLTFVNESEAQIAKSALNAFGIDAILSQDDCGGQRPHLTMAGGIQLLVRSADAEQAEDVLTSQFEVE